MEENDVYFTKLRNPIDIRRAVLETTKDVLETLQRFERFKSLREEKLKNIEQLKTDIKEISKLVNKLKTELPPLKVRLIEAPKPPVKEEVKEEPKPKKKIKKKAVKKLPEKEISELNKLEAELSEIEKRLSKIG